MSKPTPKRFLSYSSITVIKQHDQKQHRDAWVLLQSIIHGSQGINLEANAEAEATEENCCLARSHGLFSLISYTIQDHMARAGMCLQGAKPYRPAFTPIL